MRSTFLPGTAAAVLIAVAGCDGPVAGSGSALPGRRRRLGRERGPGPGRRPGHGQRGGRLRAAHRRRRRTVRRGRGGGRENSVGGDGGDLPEWDDDIGPEQPLPGDKRAWGGGQVEFVVDGCFLQVATTDRGEADQEAAVELIEKVRAQL